jgi:hypothetical protein
VWYNGYYSSFPNWRRGFDSRHPHQKTRTKEGPGRKKWQVFFIMIVQSTARIHRLFHHEAPFITTTATAADGRLHVRTMATSYEARQWRSTLEERGDVHTLELPTGTATLLYNSEKQRTGTATAYIVDRYLDEGHIPHEMGIRPGPLGDWMAVSVESSLNTISVTGRPR